jgi:hypothetical protein
MIAHGAHTEAMSEFSPFHAIGVIRAIRESTRGYGPPSRDPLSRRQARPERKPRRGLRRERS